MNKDDKDLLWLCIISITEQLLFGKIENERYVLEIGNLQEHSIRLKNRTVDSDIATSIKINFENDLKLILYRHWTVESSLKYSIYTACKMRLWTVRGYKKLQELLADMGLVITYIFVHVLSPNSTRRASCGSCLIFFFISFSLPLVQSKQLFNSMDLQLRQEFKESVQKFAEKYNLDDITYATFTLQYGYRNKYSASDIVYSLLAILEISVSKSHYLHLFCKMLQCLIQQLKNFFFLFSIKYEIAKNAFTRR